MKQFPHFNKRLTALATVGGLLLFTATAFAWFVGSNGEVQLCIDKSRPHLVRALPAGGTESCGANEEAVTINQQGPAGPAGPAGPTGATGPTGPAGETNVLAVHRNNGPTSPNSSELVILTLPNVPPGNYVALAKTFITRNSGAPTDEITFCSLIVSAGGGPTTVMDLWEEHGSGPWTVNLQRPIALNPSIATAYTVQLKCFVSPLLGWHAIGSSIILIPATNLNETETNN
jgi:hypothetical protein